MLLATVARDLDHATGCAWCAARTRSSGSALAHGGQLAAAGAPEPARPCRTGRSERAPQVQLLALITLDERMRMELTRFARAGARGGARRSCASCSGSRASSAQTRRTRRVGWMAEQIESVWSLPTSPLPCATPSRRRSPALQLSRSAAWRCTPGRGSDPIELANLASFSRPACTGAPAFERGAECPPLSVATATRVAHLITDARRPSRAQAGGGHGGDATVIALTTQRPDMTAALWTVFIAGMPSHGATWRRWRCASSA